MSDIKNGRKNATEMQNIPSTIIDNYFYSQKWPKMIPKNLSVNNFQQLKQLLLSKKSEARTSRILYSGQ